MFRKLVPPLFASFLLFPACADDTVSVEAASPIAVMQAAPDKATEAGTVRFEMTFRVTGAPDGDHGFSTRGAADREDGTLQLSMDLAAVAGALESEGMAGFDEPIELIVDGSTAYLRIPFLAALTGTTGWLSASPEDLGGSAEVLGLGGAAGDPSRLLDTLRGVADDVQEDGHEDVRGVPTTRYTATIDLSEALAAVPEAERGPLQDQLDRLGAGAATVPVTVWIDDDGLTRRFELALDDIAADAEDAIGGTMILELFDYGEPVDIDVPSPDDVTPLQDILGSLGGALTDEAS